MVYDLIIIGLGPAGLSASIYASRYKINHLITGEVLGGEFSRAAEIGNLPGFISISGLEWTEMTKKQAEKLGAKLILARVNRLEKKAKNFKVYLQNGQEFETKTLIIATGSERRQLNLPGESEYLGKGVSYCTTCDAPFFKGKTVAIIGGSDAAVSGAVHAAELAQKVYLVYRGEQLRSEPGWIEEWKKLEGQNRGIVIYQTNLTAIVGDGSKVNGIKLDQPYQGKEILAVEGVFIEIGGVPGSVLLKLLGVSLNEAGYVQVNEKMETNIAGLFAAGDVTDKSVILAQAITAMAQGAMAAASAYKFLKGEKAPQILGLGLTKRAVMINNKSMKKPVVDQNKCIGCGTCVSLCPQAFEIGPEGKAQVKPEAKEQPCIEEAIAACPVKAISWQ